MITLITFICRFDLWMYLYISSKAIPLLDRDIVFITNDGDIVLVKLGRLVQPTLLCSCITAMSFRPDLQENSQDVVLNSDGTEIPMDMINMDSETQSTKETTKQRHRSWVCY